MASIFKYHIYLYKFIGFSSKQHTARWLRLGKSQSLTCIQKSDVQLNCNGTIVRVKDNTTIETENLKGRYDGNRSIFWTNGDQWVNKGNYKY